MLSSPTVHTHTHTHTDTHLLISKQEVHASQTIELDADVKVCVDPLLPRPGVASDGPLCVVVGKEELDQLISLSVGEGAVVDGSVVPELHIKGIPRTLVVSERYQSWKGGGGGGKGNTRRGTLSLFSQHYLVSPRSRCRQLCRT